MNRRRNFLAIALCSALAFGAGQSLTAQPLMVEIFAMPHPPVRAALQPLRDWLAKQGSRIQVREIDIESPEGVRRMQAAGLSGHVPVLIMINGQHNFSRQDGSRVAFVNFPNTPDTPVGARGEWTTTDVQSVVNGLMK
jgi:ABC-type glycerol-3-phosphate transport system substrate-binding protein